MSEVEKKLDKAMQNTRTVKYFGYLNMLWPNVQDTLLHVADLVGSEIQSPRGDELFLDLVLRETQKTIQKAEKDGSIQYHTRDRDILVFFLQGLSQQTGRLLNASVRTEARAWNPCQETFTQWRQRHPSKPLQVIWPRGDKISAEQTRAAAELILGEKEVRILDDDLPRVWGQGVKRTEVPETLTRLWEDPAKSPLRYV